MSSGLTVTMRPPVTQQSKQITYVALADGTKVTPNEDGTCTFPVEVLSNFLNAGWTVVSYG